MHDLHHFFICVTQPSVPKRKGYRVILGILSPWGTELWVLGKHLHLYQYINWYKSVFNWIKGLRLNLFDIAYLESNLVQNISLCAVFQNCYSSP